MNHVSLTAATGTSQASCAGGCAVLALLLNSHQKPLGVTAAAGCSEEDASNAPVSIKSMGIVCEFSDLLLSKRCVPFSPSSKWKSQSQNTFTKDFFPSLFLRFKCSTVLINKVEKARNFNLGTCKFIFNMKRFQSF